MNPKYQRPVAVAPMPIDLGKFSHLLNAAAVLVTLASVIQMTTIAGLIA
jgi:hypothetical protein